jgi:hypothetical protein
MVTKELQEVILLQCYDAHRLRALTKQSDEEFRSKHPTFESIIILDDCDAEGVEVFKAEVASAKLAAAIAFGSHRCRRADTTSHDGAPAWRPSSP